MRRSLNLILHVLAFLIASCAQAGEYPVFRNAEDINNEKPSLDPAAKYLHLERPATDPIARHTGPTIGLDYGAGYTENTIDEFMYFIPLVSPTPVESRLSMGNKQTARITSFKTESTEDRAFIPYRRYLPCLRLRP